MCHLNASRHNKPSCSPEGAPACRHALADCLECAVEPRLATLWRQLPKLLRAYKIPIEGASLTIPIGQGQSDLGATRFPLPWRSPVQAYDFPTPASRASPDFIGGEVSVSRLGPRSRFFERWWCGPSVREHSNRFCAVNSIDLDVPSDV